MHDILKECRRIIGKPPRTLSAKQGYLDLPKPEWLLAYPSDELKTLFAYGDDLWRTGVLAWGQIVQANSLLFEAGTSDHPGELLYSSSHPGSVDLNELQDIAGRLFDLKGTAPEDPSLLSIADYLANEVIRVYGLPVPSAISPNYKCGISTTMFFRKHLSGGVLAKPFFPILVRPKPPHLALPLPALYWPSELSEWWNT